MSGALAVALNSPTMEHARAALSVAADQADLIELRLDLFEEPYNLTALLEARGTRPVVVTLRPEGQGGRSTLSAGERLVILLRAAELGAEYVDLEWDAATPAALAGLRHLGARPIVSRHDFSGMPDLQTWWSDLAALTDDAIVKVVGQAVDVRDCLPVLQVLRQATRPTIAIGMGLPGLPSRVLALRERSCFLTYAASPGLMGTAPGQVSVSEMRAVYHAQRLGTATAVFGLLGPHVEQERLREYNTWFEQASIDAVAVAFPAEADAAGILQAYRALPVSGWHIHGEVLQRQAVAALDHLSPKAQRQAKVNSVVLQSSALVGDWIESPAEQFATWRSASVA
jgi:3-dehydroquinate dehydratase / shikimate dehydrogenase